MLRRLLASFLAVSIASLLAVCLPLGLVAQSLIRQDFDHRLQRNLQNVAAAVATITSSGQSLSPAELARLVPSDRRAVFVPHQGTAISAGRIDGAARSASTSVSGGRLTMQAPTSVLRGRVLRIWALIATLGAVAVAFAVGLALVVARRLSTPLGLLAERAERIGRGDLRPDGRRFAVAELQRLAAVLDWSAAQLVRMLQSERRLVRATSHQLRTPLTGLKVRLEDIRRRSDDPEVRQELAAALQQLERLSDLAAGALSRGLDGAAASPGDAVDAVRAQCGESRPAYERAGRKIDLDLPGQLQLASVDPVSHALAALLDNSLAHGAGTTRVTARRVGDFAVVEISDEGAGIPDELAPHIFLSGVTGGGGTGIGLPLARALVEGCGGRLELTRRRPARFSIYVPTAERHEGEAASPAG